MALSGKRGIFIAFDKEIILGTRAVKVHTSSFHAFESINSTPIGKIDSSGLIINNEKLPKYKNVCTFNDKINPNVFLLKLTPATNPNIIDMLINSDIKGIVIEAFGQGGIQFVRRDFTPYLKKAHDKNIPIIVSSQCLYDGVNLNIYEVGKKTLNTGVITANDMTNESCVTKLMWALGQSNDLKEIYKIFNSNLAGEKNI